jgi:Rod binding domain-containing protein
MPMKMKLDERPDVAFIQLLSAQFGLGLANDVVDQLVDQLEAFRAERARDLAAARAQWDRDTAELRAQQHEMRKQLVEMEVLRRELAMAKEELAVVRALAQWPAHERASLQ